MEPGIELTAAINRTCEVTKHATLNITTCVSLERVGTCEKYDIVDLKSFIAYYPLQSHGTCIVIIIIIINHSYIYKT